MDSTLIALIAKKILNKKVYLTISDINKNDLLYSQKIIKEFSFNKIEIINDINADKFNEFMSLMIFPISDFGLYILYDIYNKIKEPYITGIGTEFIFGGTINHLKFCNIFKENIKRIYKKYEIEDNYKLAKLWSIIPQKNIQNIEYLSYIKCNHSIEHLLQQEFKNKLFFTETLFFTSLYIKNNIKIECPFLSKDIVDYCFSIPIKHRINSHGFKYILIDIFKDILPDYIIYRSKQGLYYDEIDRNEIYKKIFSEKLINKINNNSSKNINRVRNELFLETWKNLC